MKIPHILQTISKSLHSHNAKAPVRVQTKPLDNLLQGGDLIGLGLLYVFKSPFMKETR